MTIERMREELAKAYPAPKWAKRVAQMDDRQVFAVYKDMERNGRLCKKCGEKTKLKEDGVQITIWDLMKEQENHIV